MTRDIRLRFFASIRETVGAGQMTFATDALTVGDLRRALCRHNPAWAEALGPGKAVRASLNQRMVDESAALMDNAEVAFFPPVTGG